MVFAAGFQSPKEGGGYCINWLLTLETVSCGPTGQGADKKLDLR
ncbi:MAG: hypothetical protein KatS3mg131_0292 [Candidatus Tectimicrobiota bacterium]|nr:MAG: hypothetical protein KatS3mg131_0292 [Candidatus Tectomicrobia bacterium]